MNAIKFTAITLMTIASTACMSISLDEQSKGSIAKQFGEQLSTEIARLQQSTEVHNIVRFQEQRKMVDGQEQSWLEFYTADNKMYRMQVLSQNVTDAQRQKLRQLKGATLTGVTPIAGATNQF
ncbi:MAG: hypothetical protein Q4D05_01145, partial [Acinetobacter sp.]|nr:hypothetical protein [Acinetobacter sp.]